MKQALITANLVDTFISGVDIEKRDAQKDNISHLLLQYDVLSDIGFQYFQMMYASLYVKKCIGKATKPI